MTRHEAPGYYCATDTPGERPPTDDCTEGRLFLTDDRLVCGAGKMGGMGYVDTLDTYSESTVRRLFGNRLDPQEVVLDTTLQQDATVVVPLSAVASAELRQWEGSRLRGAEHTFAVAVRAPSTLDTPLLLQLGRGGRNRGTGRTRHASLAQWLDALNDGAASASDAEAATDTGTGASPPTSDGSTTTREATGAADTTDAGGSAGDDPEPSTAEPQSPEPAPDMPRSGALADVARSEPVGAPAESGSETSDATADPVTAPSDAESTPSASTPDPADPGSDTAVPPEPETPDSSADSGGGDSPVGADPGSGRSDEDTDDSGDANEVTGSDGDANDATGSDGDADGVTGSDTDSEDADPEPTWLDDEPDDPALIVKNRSNIRLRPRIRCRHEGEVLFLDDIDLVPGDTHRWTEFPEEGVVHFDILFDDGSRNAEQLDERHLRSPPVGIDLYVSGAEVHPAE